jgi:hypothetical protein
MDTVYGNPIVTPPKRRELRLPATLSVRLLGIDANNKPFHQAATTIDISLSGARVTGVSAKLNVGDIVGLQTSTGKSRFQVAWVTANRNRKFELGLFCVEKGACPWREALRPTGRNQDQRISQRYPCSGSASLRSGSRATPFWGTLCDISEHGCYLQTSTTLKAGELVSGMFIVNGIQINALAEVRNTVTGVGMGLEWCDVGCDGTDKLRRILFSLVPENSGTDGGRGKALTQIGRMNQAIAALREKLANDHIPVTADTVYCLEAAHDKLAAAIKSLEI